MSLISEITGILLRYVNSRAKIEVNAYNRDLDAYIDKQYERDIFKSDILQCIPKQDSDKFPLLSPVYEYNFALRLTRQFTNHALPIKRLNLIFQIIKDLHCANKLSANDPYFISNYLRNALAKNSDLSIAHHKKHITGSFFGKGTLFQSKSDNALEQALKICDDSINKANTATQGYNR